MSRFLVRFVDRGAIYAGWVGVGMAMTIAVSFLLVIPIEPMFWLASPLAGILIGYYANARADRRAGPWRRILLNGIFASLLTAVTLAVLFAGTKAIFFFADNGYRDASQGGPIAGCVSGADCVYQRYLAEDGKAAQFEKAGITDVASFSAFYWREQAGTNRDRDDPVPRRRRPRCGDVRVRPAQGPASRGRAGSPDRLTAPRRVHPPSASRMAPAAMHPAPPSRHAARSRSPRRRTPQPAARTLADSRRGATPASGAIARAVSTSV